jgi:fucose 4-O-acetylase-like acetyltransferase
MTTIQIVHNSLLIFTTQLIFIGCRTWNVKAIAKNNMPQTIASGMIVNFSWLVSMGIGGVSMASVINNFEWQHVPIILCCIAGGTVGTYIGMKEKQIKLK